VKKVKKLFSHAKTFSTTRLNQLISHINETPLQKSSKNGNIRIIRHGKTLGEATYIITDKKMIIDGLFIKPLHRRKGFGTILLKLIERIASRSELNNISFRASPIDASPIEPLRKWYISRGYSIKRRNILSKSINQFR
jgi:GNAT superfamily N-acetyltransferase